MNAAFAALLGLDADGEYAHLSHRDRGHAIRHSTPAGQPLAYEDRPLSRVLRGEVLVGEKAVDVLFHTLDGRKVLLNCTGAPVFDEDGQLIGAVLVMRDVTERRQIEREREAMVDVVTHDLKSPLATVKSAAQGAMRRLGPGDEGAADLLAKAVRGISQMATLVNDLQDAASLESPTFPLERTRCDLAQLCRRIAEEQSEASGRPVTLDLPPRPVWVEVDPARLSQVIRNLLSNALKYSRNGTAVTLAIRRARDEVRVSVRDEGPGIPDAAQPHLFARYYRVPETRVLHGAAKGVGLGLYISRRLVELHGGHIHVTSAVGAGSTFTFTLPRAPRRDPERRA
jgi:two-component system phosphate regulon sensor histidine kinase PhoR